MRLKEKETEKREAEKLRNWRENRSLYKRKKKERK